MVGKNVINNISIQVPIPSTSKAWRPPLNRSKRLNTEQVRKSSESANSLTFVITIKQKLEILIILDN